MKTFVRGYRPSTFRSFIIMFLKKPIWKIYSQTLNLEVKSGLNETNQSILPFPLRENWYCQIFPFQRNCFCIQKWTPRPNRRKEFIKVFQLFLKHRNSSDKIQFKKVLYIIWDYTDLIQCYSRKKIIKIKIKTNKNNRRYTTPESIRYN